VSSHENLLCKNISNVQQRNSALISSVVNAEKHSFLSFWFCLHSKDTQEPQEQIDVYHLRLGVLPEYHNDAVGEGMELELRQVSNRVNCNGVGFNFALVLS